MILTWKILADTNKWFVSILTLVDSLILRIGLIAFRKVCISISASVCLLQELERSLSLFLSSLPFSFFKLVLERDLTFFLFFFLSLLCHLLEEGSYASYCNSDFGFSHTTTSSNIRSDNLLSV